MIYSIRCQQANNREACFPWERPGNILDEKEQCIKANSWRRY